MDSHKDDIIEALEEWVEGHPKEAQRVFKTVEVDGVPEAISFARMLDEMKRQTDLGRQEYKKLIQLTVDLVSRGKISLTNEIYQVPWPAGITSISKAELLRHRPALGVIECVMVINIMGDLADTEVIVVGDQARLHLDGFSLGYNGEGPQGFAWLLGQLEIPFRDIDIFGKQTEDVRIFIVPAKDPSDEDEEM